jgi:hypothetical protein
VAMVSGCRSESMHRDRSDLPGLRRQTCCHEINGVLQPSQFSSWPMTRRNRARSALAPLAVSRKTFSAPAARSCFTCGSRLWAGDFGPPGQVSSPL